MQNYKARFFHPDPFARPACHINKSSSALLLLIFTILLILPATSSTAKEVEFVIEAPKTSINKKIEKTSWPAFAIRGWMVSYQGEWYISESINTIYRFNEQVALLDRVQKTAEAAIKMAESWNIDFPWDKYSLNKMAGLILKTHPQYRQLDYLTSDMQNASELIERSKKGPYKFFYIDEKSIFANQQRVWPHKESTFYNYETFRLHGALSRSDLTTLMNAQVAAAKRARDKLKEFDALKKKIASRANKAGGK